MKNSVLWTATICGWSLALVFGYFALDARWTNQRVVLIQQLEEKRNDLLQDQIADLEAHMQVRGTYEEGFVAAMTRSGNPEYVEGYHRAMVQLADMDGDDLKEISVSYKPQPKDDGFKLRE